MRWPFLNDLTGTFGGRLAEVRARGLPARRYPPGVGNPRLSSEAR
jgi:hypothetical protein